MVFLFSFILCIGYVLYDYYMLVMYVLGGIYNFLFLFVLISYFLFNYLRFLIKEEVKVFFRYGYCVLLKVFY